MILCEVSLARVLDSSHYIFNKEKRNRSDLLLSNRTCYYRD